MANYDTATTLDNNNNNHQQWNYTMYHYRSFKRTPIQIMIAYNLTQQNYVTIDELYSILREVDVLPLMTIPPYNLCPTLCDNNKQLSHDNHALILAYTIEQLIDLNSNDNNTDNVINTNITIKQHVINNIGSLSALPTNLLQYIITYLPLSELVNVLLLNRLSYHTLHTESTFRILYQRDFITTFILRNIDCNKRPHYTYFRLYRAAIWSKQLGRNSVSQTRILARHNNCLLVTIPSNMYINLPMLNRSYALTDILNPDKLHIWSRKLYITTKKQRNSYNVTTSFDDLQCYGSDNESDTDD